MKKTKLFSNSSTQKVSNTSKYNKRVIKPKYYIILYIIYIGKTNINEQFKCF